MDDKRIIELYFARSEDAIAQSQKKYGRYCFCIAHNILGDSRDCEECVSDTWLRAWNTMPPSKPNVLSAFFAKITRNLSINRYNSQRAKMRGGGESALALEELSECVADSKNTADAEELSGIINEFLALLGSRERMMFMRRYWLLEPLSKLAKDFSLSEGTVKSMLYRTRVKLKEHLEKEEIFM